MSAPVLPNSLLHWMAPFATLFTRPTWRRVLILIAGAVLTPGRRTVTAALSIMGLREATDFSAFHRVLNRSRWSSRAVARQLLVLLVASFVPQGPVLIGIDETIERRWGPRIKARGIYRDPVRSSHGHFVKASGLRWMVVMLLVPIPCVNRLRKTSHHRRPISSHASGCRSPLSRESTGGARARRGVPSWLT